VSPTGVDTDWAVRVPTGYRVGAWQVTEPIATGSFGSTYAGRRVDGRAPGGPTAALKFIPVGTLGFAQFRQALQLAQREVRFSATTAHERLVTVRESLVVQDATVDFDGAVVLVMDRAAESLQDALDRAAPHRALPDARRLIREICDGLAYLHTSGWVHGDLKPSNLLLMPDGSLRLADFGLVTRLDGTHGYGPPLGTTDYQPPERWDDGLTDQGVQIRASADVWALGVTAHQVLTGGLLPFAGGTPGARVAAAQEFAAGRAPLRLGDLPPGWAEFVARCLDPDPLDRPSAMELLHLAGRLAKPTRRRWVRRWGPSRARRRWLVQVGLPLAGLGVAAAAVFAVRPTPSGRDGGTDPGGVAEIAGVSPEPIGLASTRPATRATSRPAASPSASPSPSPSPSAPRTLRLRVFNVETACQTAGHTAHCSLGLAIDPHKAYVVSNVSAHRVWHGDLLTASCVLRNGQRVADETGTASTSWYRVAVDTEPTGYAWLPAVRTHDDTSALSGCPQ
jgi:serine/threonine-protein kinase